MPQKVYAIGELDSRSNLGVVTAINPLVKYLKKAGLDIECLTYDRLPKKNVFKFYRSLSTLNIKFPSISVTRNFRNLWAIRAIQEVGEEDILHIHSFTLLPHLLQSLRVPRKVILTYYGTHTGIIDVDGPTNPYYLRAIFNIPDTVIVDESDRNMLLERAQKHLPNEVEQMRSKMILFPFIGIDDEVFDPDRIESHPWYRQNINKDGLIVFKGGAIESMKGDSILIKIAKEILSKRKNVYFVWGGYFRRYPPKQQAILEKELKRLCEKYPKNTFYLGTYQHSELPSFLNGADVVPHFHKKVSNILSTFGREATMMGRYVLATNIGWYKTLMSESKGLRVFDWGDDNTLIKEVSNELTYLADNVDETRKKGMENRTHALKYCSAKISAKQHMVIYKALANNEAMPTTEELLSISRKHTP
jgi:hypothetical protein